MVVYQPPLPINTPTLTPGTCLSWIPAEQLGGVGGLLRLPPTVGWREDALLRLVLHHRKEPYDHFRCGAYLDSFSSPTLKLYGQWLTRVG
jgi:hypothetical protein